MIFRHVLRLAHLRHAALLLALLCSQLAVLAHAQEHPLSNTYSVDCEFHAAGVTSGPAATLPVVHVPALLPMRSPAIAATLPIAQLQRSPRLSQGPPALC